MADLSAVRVDSRLADSPARNRTFLLPDLLSDVVDELVDKAGRAGYSTGRAQVVSGLILAARDYPAEEVERLAREFLTVEVSAVAGDRAADGYVVPRPTAPGRRPSNRTI